MCRTVPAVVPARPAKIFASCPNFRGRIYFHLFPGKNQKPYSAHKCPITSVWGGRRRVGVGQITAHSNPYSSFSSSSCPLCVRRGFDEKFCFQQCRTLSISSLFVNFSYIISYVFSGMSHIQQYVVKDRQVTNKRQRYTYPYVHYNIINIYVCCFCRR